MTSISFQSLMTSSLLWQEEKKFSKVDFANAYQQVLLDEESRELVTVNTHRGLYQFTRLPFGIASAPEVFQNLMDQILQRTGGTGCYLDDIIVTGKNDEDHLNLSVVLSRLQKYGLRLKRSNSVCVQPEVEFLGYRINKTGLHTSDKKVTAIKQAPTPKNVTQLRSFLGFPNYYGRLLLPVLWALAIWAVAIYRCTPLLQRRRTFRDTRTHARTQKRPSEPAHLALWELEDGVQWLASARHICILG